MGLDKKFCNHECVNLVGYDATVESLYNRKKSKNTSFKRKKSVQGNCEYMDRKTQDEAESPNSKADVGRECH